MFLILVLIGVIQLMVERQFRLLNANKRPDVLTPQFRHWYALSGRLSGTPDVGSVSNRVLQVKITSFGLDSSRSRKSVFCFGHIRIFPNIRIQAKANLLCKREFASGICFL
jgi:hypothetical protein